MSVDLHAEIILAHRKLDWLIQAVHLLMKGNPNMAIHDDILAGLTANDTAIATVRAKTDAVIAAKAAGESAFGDILPRVQAQSTTIAAIDADLTAALPVAEAPGEALAPDPAPQPSIVIPPAQ